MATIGTMTDSGLVSAQLKDGDHWHNDRFWNFGDIHISECDICIWVSSGSDNKKSFDDLVRVMIDLNEPYCVSLSSPPQTLYMRSRFWDAFKLYKAFGRYADLNISEFIKLVLQ